MAATGEASASSQSDDTFEIGIVLAGAVSAGAYTAGVLDFLFEALDAWSLAKARGEDVPRHNVVLRVITGASAGGMNGAIAASALHYDYPHARATDGPEHNSALGNPFYAAWVKKIDMQLFLELEDLDKDPLPSLLDSSELEKIVEYIVTYEGPAVEEPQMRQWIANPLPILLTVSNLRGVPYDVQFSGAGSARGHGVTLHQDHVGFAAEGLSDRAFENPYAWQDGDTENAPTAEERDKLRDLRTLPSEKAYEGRWKELGQAALATGAFPAFLAPRLLKRDLEDYDYRYPYKDSEGRYRGRRPVWPEPAPDPYAFLCVDGGAMNNEPFELARLTLAGDAEKNPRAGKDAAKAVVMIDPLTDAARLGPDSRVNILKTAGQLLSSLVQQARFTPSQYALATDDNVYSRFMIAPSRGETVGDSSLAGAGLGAFLGFFSEAYRRHDFMLGRRNCQRFLSQWFTLPEDNAIMDAAGNEETLKRFVGAPRESGKRHYQIVPLVGRCAEEEERRPCWPKGKYRLDDTARQLIDRRVKKATAVLLDQMLARPKGEGIAGYLKRQAVKAYLKTGLFFARGWIASSARKEIEAAVAKVDARETDGEDCVP